MIIKNLDALATSRSRAQVLEILEAGISRVLPTVIMRSAVRYDAAGRTLTINDDSFSIGNGRIFVIGGGKASGLMAQALEDIIGPENITDGVVNGKGDSPETRKIRIITAAHPVPDQRGVNGVAAMLTLKQRYSIGENDLVICLISGGGSALMPCPVDEISLKDKQVITEALVASGAEIADINTVRKHLSKIKGGKLGSYYSPAKVISLILSDVIGNDLSVIASGPTFPDGSTFSEAYDVLRRYHLLNRIPESAADYLEKVLQGGIKDNHNKLPNCHNYIIGDNNLALEAMEAKAREIGLRPLTVTARQKGNTNEVARLRASETQDRRYAEYNVLLIGGETTIKVRAGAGKGGRNQHYAAVSMLAMARYPGEWTVASIGTDGSDYLPDAAGAIVDHNSLDNARDQGLDVPSHLKKFDSYNLLARLGNSLIITGDTGTNVGDIIIYHLA